VYAWFDEVLMIVAPGASLHRLVELLVAEVDQRLDVLLLRGVVHHDVEASELRDRLLDQGAAVRRVGDVARDSDARASGLPNQPENAVGIRLLFGEVRDDDVGTLAGECDGDGRADARVATGDQRFSTGQPPCSAVRLLAVVCPVVEPHIEPGAFLVLGCRVDLGVECGGIPEGVLVGHEDPFEEETRASDATGGSMRPRGVDG
jgi:hypothetical protein